MRIIPLLFLAGLIFAACGRSQKDPDDHVHQDQTEEGAHGFEVLSSDYYQSPSRVIWQKPDLVLSLLGNLRGKTVADIGAGTGFFAFRIANQGAKVIAIDIDPRAIAWMNSEKQRYPADIQALLETRLGQPDDPGLSTQEADLILMVNTYIYLTDRVRYFRNLRKGLKPTAEMVIIDFKDQDTPIGPALEERIGMQQVQMELTEAGYSITTVDSTSLEYQYILKAAY